MLGLVTSYVISAIYLTLSPQHHRTFPRRLGAGVPFEVLTTAVVLFGAGVPLLAAPNPLIFRTLWRVSSASSASLASWYDASCSAQPTVFEFAARRLTVVLLAASVISTGRSCSAKRGGFDWPLLRRVFARVTIASS